MSRLLARPLAFLFVLSAALLATATSAHAEQTFTVSGNDVYGEKIAELVDRLEDLQTEVSFADEDEVVAISQQLAATARELGALRKKARAYRTAQVTFHGPSVTRAHVDTTLRRFRTRPEMAGGHFHVYLTPDGAPKISENSPVGRIRHQGPAANQPRGARRSAPSPRLDPAPFRGGGGSRESRVHEDATPFGQG